MVKLHSLSTLILALAGVGTEAFAPSTNARTRSTFVPRPASTLTAPEVDVLGNNIAVRDLLVDVESSGLLTKVAESGILSKAQEAGVSLSKLEQFLDLASDNPELLVLVEASGPELLPLLPKLVDLAPGALPLLAVAVQISPGTLQAGAFASLLAAAATVVLVPDDTVAAIALQTLAVGVLGIGIPVASLTGSVILSKVTR